MKKIILGVCILLILSSIAIALPVKSRVIIDRENRIIKIKYTPNKKAMVWAVEQDIPLCWEVKDEHMYPVYYKNKLRFFRFGNEPVIYYFLPCKQKKQRYNLFFRSASLIEGRECCKWYKNKRKVII